MLRSVPQSPAGPQNLTVVFWTHSAQVPLKLTIDVFIHTQNTLKSTKL